MRNGATDVVTKLPDRQGELVDVTLSARNCSVVIRKASQRGTLKLYIRMIAQEIYALQEFNRLSKGATVTLLPFIVNLGQAGSHQR